MSVCSFGGWGVKTNAEADGPLVEITSILNE
jgi:hypothetical protein